LLQVNLHLKCKLAVNFIVVAMEARWWCVLLHMLRTRHFLQHAIWNDKPFLTVSIKRIFAAITDSYVFNKNICEHNYCTCSRWMSWIILSLWEWTKGSMDLCVASLIIWGNVLGWLSEAIYLVQTTGDMGEDF